MRGGNSGFVPLNSNYIHRNWSNNFIPRNSNQGFVPQGNLGNAFGKTNVGSGRGSYGLSPHLLRKSNVSQGSGDGSDLMDVEFNNNQQGGFDSFSGNFGEFDEGYHENN
jgi:hypothetical protein